MNKKRTLAASFTFMMLFLFNLASAQQQTMEQDSLYSKVLNEERKLHVVLPKDYNPSSGKYEIVYCLDDISNFLTMEWDFLRGEGFIPNNMILVGITNPKPNGVDMRDRDFTPTKIGGISGGAERFLSFIKTELIPYIGQKYRASGNGHVLYGGSLGGLFVLYTFLKDPALFTSYIAIDPSLWWDNFLLNSMASAKFDSVKVLHNTLFIVGREGNAYREMGIAGMDSVLRTKAPAGLNWKCVAYTNETHYSTNFKGFWDGLKFSYGGFYASTGGYPTSRKIVIKPKTGVVRKGVPFRLICYNLTGGAYLHYTTDGTEPTSSSPTLAGEETPIRLDKDSKVIVKSIGVRTEYNRMDSAYFVIGDTFKALALPRKLKPAGLTYAYYEGTWDSLPDVKHLKPLKRGTADKNFDVNQFNGSKDYACILNGYLKINQPGYYILEMGGGNDRSKVYLNNQLILGRHFIQGEGEMFLVPLEAGYYPFRVEYFHKKGGTELAPIYIKPEGVEDFQIPIEMLYSESN